MTRTHRTTSAFARPFRLRGVDRVLPAGSYDIVTEEELIEGLSFPVYRRVSTVIFVPGQSASMIEHFCGVPVWSRDNGFTGPQGICQGSRYRLRFVAIGRDVNVGRADQRSHLFGSDKPIDEQDLLFHSHLLC